MAALEDTYRTLFGDTIDLEELSLSQHVSTLSETLLQKVSLHETILKQPFMKSKVFHPVLLEPLLYALCTLP